MACTSPPFFLEAQPVLLQYIYALIYTKEGQPCSEPLLTFGSADADLWQALSASQVEGKKL